MLMNRRNVMVAAAAAACGSSWAQALWPEKPIKLVVGYAAGGGMDVVARIYAARLSLLLKQQVIVENRVGATGSIGAAYVAKSDPDGYTFHLGSPSEMLIAGVIGQRIPYVLPQDFTPVAMAGDTPLLIAAHPSVMPGTPHEFVKQARANKKTYTYGSPGTGTPMHFVGAAMKSTGNIDFLHVPYKGAAPAVNDALGHQIDFVISGMPPLVSHIKAGKLKALAITSEKRSPLLPDVPTVNELLGIKDFRFTNWMTVYGPARLPAHLRDALARDIRLVAEDPQAKESLIQGGVDPTVLTGSALDRFLGEELERYLKVQGQANIKTDG
jgi:tripartite-type tricarboxylate transporter receptor subunit TctC